MLSIGTVVLYAIIALFAFVSIGILVALFLDSRRAKEKATKEAEQPRKDSLAEQIQKQFQDDEERKERVIYTKSGISKATMRDTRSVFSFAGNDTDNKITLESQSADDETAVPFIEEKNTDRI
jgi:lipopolysaccharide export LptBFGC system permease protein LptF